MPRISPANALTKGILKCVRYTQGGSTSHKGGKTYTHTAPDGYTLLVDMPLGAYTSGDATTYITDRSASQSGNTVTVYAYIHNPNTKSISVAYSLLYVKSQFA